MSPSRSSSTLKCAFLRPRNLVLFLSLLAVGCALGFPLKSVASATSRTVPQREDGVRSDAARQTANVSGASGASAAVAADETPFYGQPSDGRGSEGPSSKLQGGQQQLDKEVADDFDLNATITRVRARGVSGSFNSPPPTYYGVYVRFYDGAGGMPGALQAEHYLPQGSPGVVYDAARPNTFDITLPTPFNANGRHFLSVQPVFGGAEAWSVLSSGYSNVRGSVCVTRDRLTGGAWTLAGIAGYRQDMSFDLFGTLLSAPRIDKVSPNPVPRSGLVRITGAHFGSAQGSSQLTIDGKPSQYIAHWSDNLVVAYVPETSALGDVPVGITFSGKTGTATLNVTTRPAVGRIRWQFTVAGGHVPRRSAIGPDGTIYVNDVKGQLYALSPDGGLKWVFQAGFVSANGPVSVGADGTVYVGGLVPKNPATQCESDQFLVNVDGIFAVRPDGTQKWLFDKTCDGLLSGPNVGPDGKIHAVTDATGIGAFALHTDGTLAHAPTGRFGVDGARGTEIVFGPAAPGQAPTQKYFQYESGGLFGYTLDGQRVFLYQINAVGITQPVAGQRTGTVYTITDQQTAGRLFAVSPQGTLRWVSPIRPISNLSIPDAPPSESAVYVVQDGAKLHRVNPEDGSVVWTFSDNNEQLFNPIASPDDRLILMGGQANYNQPGFFEAVSSDGRQLWKQLLPDETGLAPYGQVVPRYRARFTADGQTAYVAAHVSGADYSATVPSYSFFYALDTSGSNAPVNQPPKATVTSPLSNTDAPINTQINITATVEDDGQIERVDFYYFHNGNRTMIGSDTTPDADGIYRARFTPTQTGGHSIAASAYDVGGLRGDSQSALVWITDRRPTISWVSPTNGANFAAPASIALTARAADPDGKIAGVEFKTYQNGVVGYSVIGSDTTPDADGNYGIEWATPPQGTYEITATAIDNSGFSQSAVLTLTVGPAVPKIYTIGGTVRDSGGQPMSGVVVTLGGSLSATVTTGADGAYLFSDLRGDNNYSVTPARAGYSFSPTQHVYHSLGANQTGDFNGARNSYTVSGQIKDNNNVGFREVAVTVSGGQTPTTLYTDANGNYSFNLPAGGTYTVTPSLVNYAFAPASQSFTNLSADQTANFTAARNTHSIGGQIRDNNNEALAGVTVTLSGSQSATATTDANGNYSFDGLAAGGNYVVTPSRSFFNFNPASAAFNNLSGNQSANFAGAPVTVTISGRVRDAAGNGIEGATIAVNGERNETINTDANGQFVLRNIPSGGNYTVTPSKEGFTFNPSHLVFANPAIDQNADFVATPNAASVQFGAATFNASESGVGVKLTVTRTGNMAGTVSVAYRTNDNPAAVRCDDNTSMPGTAFARCDYATSVDRISFAPGEASASVTIPLVDDSHPENSEFVEIVLSEPVGATIGSQATARFTITDNDAPNAPNAIDGNEFFVRMQYLDFLNREPDAEGKAAWQRVLDNCVNNDLACDRNTVSSSFFRSQEFQLKGYFVYLFYKVALNRLPQYAEITPDMRSVSGQTGDEVYRKRAGFAARFVERAAFRELYDTLSDQAFIDTLLNRYNLAAITTRDPANPEANGRVTLTSSQLLNQLSARSLSRAQVLRAVVESDEVAAVEYNGAFVAMQYFGYLRRDPDMDGFNAWLRVLNANPQDYRTMVHGFESSVEYRLRFGQP